MAGNRLFDESSVWPAGPAPWPVKARAAISWVAERREEFTTDAVWWKLEKEGVATPLEPRAMGNAMAAAEGRGVIEATDRTKPTHRPEAHGRPVRVWRSLTFRNGA